MTDPNDPANDTPPKDHQYKEAFCLMWYACDCGHRERVWNSRNGITPFILGCPSCSEGKLAHVAFVKDRPTPDHQPRVGQGVFLNMTLKRATYFAERRMDCFDGTEFELQGQERIDMIKEIAMDNYSRFGAGTSPDFIRHLDGVTYA